MRRSRIIPYSIKSVITVFLLFVLCLVHQASMAQDFQFLTRRKKINVPFKIVKNLIVVQMSINGTGPYNFILDTGVGIVLITDAKLVDSLQLQNVRKVKIAGLGQGNDLLGFVTPSIKLNLTPVIQGNMAAVILQDPAFDLSGFTGMKITGLIGYELFNSFIIKINYQMNMLTLYRSESAYILKKGAKIPMSIEEHKPYVKADLQLDTGKPFNAKLIIDTGAGHPLSLETNAGVPFQVQGKKIPANLGVGLAGEIFGYIARIRSVKLGKYEIKNVIASFPDYRDVGNKVISISRNGNIGNNILKRFTVVFDYKREAMFLAPNSHFKDPFEHDMSGIEFTSFGEGFKRIMITRVEPGSAAAEAGLAEGDEILSINFVNVDEMGVEKIDELFRSMNDKNLLLYIRPKNSPRTIRIILTLKRRI